MALTNAAVQRIPMKPTLQVEVDLAKAQQFNIKPGDVRRTVATLLAGLGVGSLFENQKVFEVVVWGTPGAAQQRHRCAEPARRPPRRRGQVRVADVAQVGSPRPPRSSNVTHRPGTST